MGHRLKSCCFAFTLAVLALCICQLSVIAQALSTVSLEYVSSGVEFRLYKVGSIENNNAVLTGDFGNYQVNLYNKAVASTLAAYVQRDNLAPASEVKTDNSNKAVFEGLDRGVYLILGDDCTVGNKKYIASPVLVSVMNNGNDSLITITGKYETQNIGGGGGGTTTNQRMNLSVFKVWKGGGTKRDVTIQLLRDGVVDREVVLNSTNNWRHTWKGLSTKASWSVAEKNVAQGFKVSIEKNGSLYVVTNLYAPNFPGEETPTEVTTTDKPGSSENNTKPQPPDSGNPPRDDNPPSDGSNPPSSVNPPTDGTTPNGGTSNGGTTPNGGTLVDGTAPSGGPGTNNVVPGGFGSNVTGTSPDNGGKPNSTQSGTNKEKLPQTGQLWWPVPFMTVAGVLLVILGIGFKRNESYAN